jgi:hypothetical protein
MDSLDFLILILNLCILSINLDLQIFIKSNGVYSSFLINVRISRPFFVVTKVIMRPNLGSLFLSSLFEKQFYFHLIYIRVM